MSKILITGGAGFIGSHFVKAMIQDSDYEHIIIVDSLTYAGDMKRLSDYFEDDDIEADSYFIDEATVEAYGKKITFLYHDIESLSSDFLRIVVDPLMTKIETFVHFCAETHVDNSIENSAPFLETNVMGTHNALELARYFEVDKFVNISTDEVYGHLTKSDVKQGVKFTEQSPLMPRSPYSASKAGADMLGRAYFETHKLPVITVRPTNAYGRWQHVEKFMPKTITNILSGLKVPLYGDGSNMREWLHVLDFTEAIKLIVEKGVIGEIYNVGGDNLISNKVLLKYIVQYLGKNFDEAVEHVEDRKAHDFAYNVNCEKIKELGWNPYISFPFGLEDTINWYKKKHYGDL